MGKILGAYLLPHPPIIIPEIGRGEESKISKTIRSMKIVAEDIRKKKPDIIIIITPHGPLFSDAISVSYERKLEGDFGKFGAPELKYVFDNNMELAEKIIRDSGNNGIICAAIDREFKENYGVDTQVDHGALVPLYFITKEYKDFKLVHITYGLLSSVDLYKFGMVIKKAVEESEKNVVFIASGDLSHRLTKDAPAGYNIRGKDFDEKIVSFLEEGNYEGIMSFDKDLVEAAGECGLRSLEIMCGFLDGFNTVEEVISYEGPFGVGYCVTSIDILGKSEEHKLLDKLIKAEENMMSAIRSMEDKYVKLARESLEYYVKNKEVMEVPTYIDEELLSKRAGVFVSIKKDGQLRGCIGTIAPTEGNLAKEIIENAIKAGTQDPRFYPVDEDELGKLVYSVDILKEPEEVQSLDELDVRRYGVIVKKGHRSGLLLPNLEGVNTPEEQISIALKKAGIMPSEAYTIQRFEVERHH